MGHLPLTSVQFDRYVDDTASHYQFLPRVLQLEQAEDFDGCHDEDGHPDWARVKEGFRQAPALRRAVMAEAVMLLGQRVDLQLQMISELGYDTSAIEGAMTIDRALLVTEAVEEWVKDPTTLAEAERRQRERVNDAGAGA